MGKIISVGTRARLSQRTTVCFNLEFCQTISLPQLKTITSNVEESIPRRTPRIKDEVVMNILWNQRPANFPQYTEISTAHSIHFILLIFLQKNNNYN